MREIKGTVLRGIVAEKFGTCAKFATALGWTAARTGDIVSGRQTARADDIKHMAEVLGITDAEEIVRVFVA